MSNSNRVRRQISLALAASTFIRPVFAQARDIEGPYIEALRRGNCMVLIRHAITVPGIGDPPGMRLDDCSTQRDLSAEGRAQSRRFGQWFRKHGLTPSRVRSSQWCRCLNTAKEAFSEKNFGTPLTIEPWTALNSFFQGHGNRHAQLEEAVREARSIAVRKSLGQFEVWVTHQVTISSLANHYTSMGEMIVAAYDAPEKPLKVLASGLAF
jgi:broad specificity phosphatase PhoE